MEMQGCLMPPTGLRSSLLLRVPIAKTKAMLMLKRNIGYGSHFLILKGISHMNSIRVLC